MSDFNIDNTRFTSGAEAAPLDGTETIIVQRNGGKAMLASLWQATASGAGWVTPEAYGAYGDGLTHPLRVRFGSLLAAQMVYPAAISLDDETDWCAIMKALSAINQTTGGTLYLAGMYLINRTITLPQKVSIIGDGWSAERSADNSNYTPPTGCGFILRAGSDCDMFRQSATPTNRVSYYFAGFFLDGRGNEQTSSVIPDPDNPGKVLPGNDRNIYQYDRNGFYLRSLTNTWFSNVRCQNMRGAGWVFDGDSSPLNIANTFLVNCTAYNCRTYCVDVTGGSTDVRFYGGDFGFGRVSAVRLGYSSTMFNVTCWTSQCQDITDAATHATGTGPVVNGGITIYGVNARVFGGRSEGHGGHGVRAISGATDFQVVGLTVYFNGASSSGTYDGIIVDDGCARYTITSNDVRQSPSGSTVLRRALTAGTHASPITVTGNSFINIGANAAAVDSPVSGVATTDVSDWNWLRTNLAVTRSGATQAAGAAFAKVQFANETTDTLSEYSTTGDNPYCWVVKNAGPYWIRAGILLALTTGGNQAALRISVNGTDTYTLDNQHPADTNSNMIKGDYVLTVAEGDVVSIESFAGGGGTIQASPLNYFTVRPYV